MTTLEYLNTKKDIQYFLENGDIKELAGIAEVLLDTISDITDTLLDLEAERDNLYDQIGLLEEMLDNVAEDR